MEVAVVMKKLIMMTISALCFSSIMYGMDIFKGKKVLDRKGSVSQTSEDGSQETSGRDLKSSNPKSGGSSPHSDIKSISMTSSSGAPRTQVKSLKDLQGHIKKSDCLTQSREVSSSKK